MSKSAKQRLTCGARPAITLAESIDIIRPTAWVVDGELWRFRDGATVAVGDKNDLAVGMVTAHVAMALINAGKADVAATTEIGDVERSEAEEAA